MTNPIVPQPNDALDPIREVVRHQTWYEETSKAVSGAIGTVISLVWLALSQGFDIPDSAQKWGFVVISLLTVFGIYQTPGGITQSQFEKIKDAYSARHRRL
jgi:hypothetical protein